jgi:hypothetical protein
MVGDQEDSAESVEIGDASLRHWMAPLLILAIGTVILSWALWQNWPRCEEYATDGPCSTAMKSAINPGMGSTAKIPNTGKATSVVKPEASPAASSDVPARTPIASPTLPLKDAGSSDMSTSSKTTTSSSLVIDSLVPTSGSSCGGTPVTITAKGLAPGQPDIRFGGLRAEITEIKGDPGFFIAMTPKHWEGPVDVTVRVDDKSVTILKGFNYICPDRTQAHLLLLVILAGALGGAFHSLRSMSWYIATRGLLVSWLPRYLLLPIVGGALSILVFLVFAGGFFSTQGGDGQSYFYMVGVSAIVGMFSDQAVEKLKKISVAIFSAPDAAPGAATKPSPLAIAELKPKSGSQAGNETIELKGTGFEKGTKVIFGGAQVTPVKLTSTAITVTTPPHAAGKVAVEVANPDGSKAASEFEYK